MLKTAFLEDKTMVKVIRRGYEKEDEKDFSEESVKKLNTASEDLYYLLNKNYKIKGASTFVGNHYLLTERQRLAIVRAVSPEKNIVEREIKKVTEGLENKTIYIDGFNTIITLEVALSDSTLLKCMDGCIRDLAGLRGTYKLIDKTDKSIMLIGKKLEELKVEKVEFYLDQPVSNSGRLKTRIIELLAPFNFKVQVFVINDVDKTLQEFYNVVSSDAIILDKCKSWINYYTYKSILY